MAASSVAIAAVLVFVSFIGSAVAETPGMIMYFDAQSCPAGWEDFAPAKGRLVVSVTDSSNAGVTVGKPLGDRENRVHVHTYKTTANLPEKEVAAIGCCNDQGAAHNNYPISTNTSQDVSSLPFSQFILCRIVTNTTTTAKAAATARVHSNDGVASGDDNPIVPFGTVAFFDPDVPQCPPNWLPYTESNGRVLVPAYKNGGSIASTSAPLASGEDRTHTHSYDVTFSTTDVSYAGADGCCNTGPAAAGTVHVAGTTDPVSLGLPYIQLLTCQSTSPTFNSSLPAPALVWNSVRCAPGYNISFDIAGRFPVVLPEGGLAGASFGGDSLKPGATGDPTHHHTVSGSVATSAAGVGLASGCCGDGYAAHSTYTYSGASADMGTEFPYLLAPLCKKQGAQTRHRPQRQDKQQEPEVRTKGTCAPHPWPKSTPLVPRNASSIFASNWSVGAETMDRNFTDFDLWARYLPALGVKHARVQSGWARTQPSKIGASALPFAWEWLDDIVYGMQKAGVTPWIQTSFGNPAIPGAGSSAVSSPLPSGTQALAAWDVYVAALVNRYASVVSTWEIWNEPNVNKISAEDYAAFAVRTAKTIKRAQSNASIWVGALGGVSLSYASDMMVALQSFGPLDWLDAVTYHPYAYNPDSVYDEVAKLRDLVHKAAPNAKIVQGENGAPSVGGGYGALSQHNWTELSQAKWALRRLLGDGARGIPSSLFSMADMCYTGSENHKGLLLVNCPDKTVVRPKMAYHAVQYLTAVFDGAVQPLLHAPRPTMTASAAGSGRFGTAAPEAFAFEHLPSGAGVLVYWNAETTPSETLSPESTTPLKLSFESHNPALFQHEHVVFCDLLKGVCYQVPDSCWSYDKTTNVYEFNNLPAFDAPLLVADNRALQL